MTQELTISQYKNDTSTGYEVMTSVFFFIIFSGITMLGIWIFKFGDNTSPSITGSKREEKYFDELAITGITLSYVFLLALIIVIYHHHHQEFDDIPV
jgi:heme/copper-type cytochrome/quinol oxidase subunit 2